MSLVKTKIPDDVRPILARSTIAGNVLTLPGQLDRETYLRVDKVLKATRGKWDRKAKGHVFPFDPRELIGEAIETGEAVDAKKTLQFFETPDDLARRMVELARLKPGDTALEPSAGLGRIVRHLIAAGGEVRAIEIDGTNAAALRALDGNPLVQHMDFEDWHAASPSAPGLFHAVVMNPPFANNQDIRHIRAAWEHVLPGGRLVAICSEGPFFRQDMAAKMFRDWLDSIGAETEKLPPETFRESGTGVNTRLISATNAAPADPFYLPGGTAEPIVPLASEGAVQDIPVQQIAADPGQPRKTFDHRELGELAASIRANGLLQPITVRVGGEKGFLIVAGERRYRAHRINGAATIRAIVIEAPDEADIRIKQIIENDQRADVPPLEQAKSYQALMDQMGWTPAELGARIGKAAHRITERTDLLRLQPEYQGLLAGGNLKPSEATELARLAPRGQMVLFKAIQTGACKTYADLRATANALVHAEAQVSFALETQPGPTEEDQRLATGFEAQVERIALMLRTGIRDNQVVAVRKVSPHRAGVLADQFGAMQKDLRRIEVALRTAAIQESFLAG